MKKNEDKKVSRETKDPKKYTYFIEDEDKSFESLLIARIAEGGRTERYNQKTKRWVADYVEVPKIFIGGYNVDVVSEEEMKKIIKQKHR